MYSVCSVVKIFLEGSKYGCAVGFYPIPSWVLTPLYTRLLQPIVFMYDQSDKSYDAERITLWLSEFGVHQKKGERSMKSKRILWVALVAVAGALALAGCRPKNASEPAGVGERTGAAIDRAAEKTVDKTKDFAETAVEKTGEALEKAGTAVQKTGADMQK